MILKVLLGMWVSANFNLDLDTLTNFDKYSKKSLFFFNRINN